MELQTNETFPEWAKKAFFASVLVETRGFPAHFCDTLIQ
jgi:hypothetical protein